MKMSDVTGTIYEGVTVYKDKPEKQTKIKPSTTGYVTDPLDDLVGDCRVVDLTEVENRVSKEDFV